MRVVSAERKIESTFRGRKKKFRIEASAKAFQILSSNLYTDKPLAIIRELSCNALDAHRDAGTLDIPFEIDLPSKLNPTLRFRDYGTGMSEEKVQGLYSTVFASDKTDNDEDIGGLGLGSKTPFSYTDTFTLITYYNGRKTIWLCYMDDDGEPAVQIAEQDDTDEPNGVEYQIPVKFEDFNAFRERVPRALCYFPPESFKTTVAVELVRYKLKNETYGLRETTGSVSGPLVLMGPVAYRLDKGAFDEVDQRKYRVIFEHNFDIFCEIGEVDFQASREALSYDKKSKKALLVILENVSDSLMNNIQEDISQCSTYLEACKTARILLSDFHYSHRGGMHWRGKSVFPDTGREMVNDEAAIVTAGDITAADQLRIGFSKYVHISLDLMLKEPEFVHYDNSCPQNNVRIKNYLKTYPNAHLVLFKSEQDMYAVMHHFQILDSISTYDMPVPEKVKNDKGQVISKAPVKIKLIKPGNSTFYETSKTIEEINETEDACWAPLFGNGDSPWEDPDHRALHDFARNRMNELFTVYGIPKSLSHKTKHLTIPDIEMYVRGLLIDKLDEDIVLLGTSHAVKCAWQDELHNRIPDMYQHLELYEEVQKHNASELQWFKSHKERIGMLLKWTFPEKHTTLSRLDELLELDYNILRYVDNFNYYTDKSGYIADILTFLHGAKS